MKFESIPGVADVELIGEGEPALLVEIPHGADRRAHYDALRNRLVGDLPADLHVFFHVNTDVGAYDYGRRVAERVVAARPGRAALLIRCLVPRTFVDTNRLEDASEGLARGGMTAGVAPYVRHPKDLELLLGLHRAYVALTEQAYAQICDGGGFALSPHTYGPRSMGLTRIDDSIVHELRKAHQPELWETWPVRPQIDIISLDPNGHRRAPDGMVDELIAGYGALGYEAKESATYTLQPAAQGTRWANRYPDQFICLEVRRDLLVEQYTPFEEMRVRPDAADRFAGPLVTAIDARLRT